MNKKRIAVLGVFFVMAFLAGAGIGSFIALTSSRTVATERALSRELISFDSEAALSKDEETEAVVDETVVASNDAGVLEGENVYLCNAYQGYAMTESDARRLSTQAKQEGYEGSTFVEWVDNGKKVVDPESGVVFANSIDGRQVDLGAAADIYILEDIDFSDMVNDALREDEFISVGEVETAYGVLNVFKR